MIVGRGVTGVETDGVAEIRRGMIVFAIGQPGAAAAEIGFGVFWIEPDRLAEIVDGAIDLALFGEGGTPKVVGWSPWDRA